MSLSDRNARVTCFTRRGRNGEGGEIRELITNNASSRAFLCKSARSFIVSRSSSSDERTLCDANVIRTLIWEFHGWHRKFKFIPPSTPPSIDGGRVCGFASPPPLPPQWLAASCILQRGECETSPRKSHMFRNKVAYLAYRTAAW